MYSALYLKGGSVMEDKINELLDLIAEDNFTPEIHPEQNEALQTFDDSNAYRT
jgi:hypothetical protein